MTGAELQTIQMAGQIAQVGMQDAKNLRQYNKQRKDNLDDWHRQNQYNSPVQQMARLKEAGLNPALMYGKSGGTGQSSSLPNKTEQSTGIVPDFNAGLGYAELELMKSNISANESQSNLNALKGATEAQNTALVKEQTAKTGAEAISAKETSNLAKELTDAQLQAQLMNIKEDQVQIEQIKQNTRLTKSNARVAEATENTKIQTAQKQFEQLQADINLKKYQADKTYAETVNRKLNNMYDAFKIQSAKEGTPIDQGAFGFMSGLANMFSSWTQQGKPPGLDPELWRDYNIYLRKNKQKR